MQIEIPIPIRHLTVYIRHKYRERVYLSTLYEKVDLTDQNAIILHNNKVIECYRKMRQATYKYLKLIDESRNKTKL